jgi:ankyrin repeat protein
MIKKVIGIILALAVCALLFIVYESRKFSSAATNQLVEAVKNNDIEMAKLAIAHRANVNAMVDKAPATLLVKAIRRGNQEMVALLLSSGADPLLKPYSHEAIPLDQSITYALGYHLVDDDQKQLKVQQDQKYIIPLLMSANKGSSYPEIIPAVLTGNMALVKMLLEDNPERINGMWLLMRATIFSADKEMISFILNMFPKNDETKQEALLWANKSSNQEIIDYVSKLVA